MMLQLKGLIFFTLFFLASCRSNEPTYAYLMEHPVDLKREAMHCEMTQEPLHDAAVCKIVMRAVNDFSAMISAQQENPEQFGERILATETACAAAKQSSDRSNIEDQCTQVNVLLAVAGLNSPE